MNYSFFLRARRRVVLRGRLGIAARDFVDGNTVLGGVGAAGTTLGVAAGDTRDFADGNTFLGSVDTVLGASTGDTRVRGDTTGDNTGGTGSAGATDACTCTTASSGGLLWPVSVSTSNR